MAVTAADVKLLVPTALSDANVDTFIATATLVVTEEFAAATLSAARSDEITKYLAAHFLSLRVREGRLTSLSVDSLRESFGGEYGMGLDASQFGQMALALDPTGALANLNATESAEFSVVLP